MNCSKCYLDYTCCKDFAVTLSREELKKYDKELTTLSENGLILGYVFVIPRPNGRCMYLNEENKCSIYDERPNACRKFNCEERWLTK